MSRSIRGVAVLLAWCLVAPFATGAEPGIAARAPYQDLARDLERWVAAEVEAKGLPALSIALVDDQEIVWSRGFGYADAARRVPATAETAYRVGSVSKLFTDLAAVQLAEQGKLDLDAPVSRVLPEFAPRNPFETPITLRHLMAHRAGLVREPPVGHYFDPSGPSLDEVVRSLQTTTLLHEPGTRTKYSNAGVAVVGAVVAQVRGEPFAGAIRRTLLEPLGMTHTSFEPDEALQRTLAHALMWSYDGQSIATPTFLLGTGPAGNLVSTVHDLGRFLGVLFAEGKGPAGPIVRPETIRAMMIPQAGKPGEAPAFGLGFALAKLDGVRRIGHGGAVYGFATELAALPDEKVGVVVVASKDFANGITRLIADTALRGMLATRRGKPWSAPELTKPVPAARAAALVGHYMKDGQSVDVSTRRGKLFVTVPRQGATVEVRLRGEELVVDDPLACGLILKSEGERITLEGATFERQPDVPPPPAPGRWAGLIGEYGWDHDVLYIREEGGTLHALIEWFFDYPLKEDADNRFRFPAYGLYEGEGLVFRRDASGRATEVEAAGVVFRRRPLDGEDGTTFRIAPVRPVEALRAETASARPPDEPGEFRAPDLVDLAALDPTIKLDIRYATTNNFLSTPLYTSARAFLQRPAAEAVLRAHRALAAEGLGLLIHDAYRPWSVTKLFWEATPESAHGFVANPAKGSRHNRGMAVDLTLYDRATGRPIAMVGGYDEFSPRSNPDYPGGTASQRWYRDRLRRAMEEQGFTVFPVEWWHFDHRDWTKYPILNRRFEELGAP